MKKKKSIGHLCGFTPRIEKSSRAKRMEWEHIVPASEFGHNRQCWNEAICTDSHGKKYKGRRCCEKMDPEFKRMEDDLMDLVPADGEVNGDRSDFLYAILNEPSGQYGQCPMVIDFAKRMAEPACSNTWIDCENLLVYECDL